MYRLIYLNATQGNMSKYKDFHSEYKMNAFIEHFKNHIQVVESYKLH